MIAYEGNEEYISQGNCIVFIQLGAGSAGYTTYQPSAFVGMSGKTSCGYSKYLNKYNAIFLKFKLIIEIFQFKCETIDYKKVIWADFCL